MVKDAKRVMTRVVLYVRVSSEAQDVELSVAAQLRHLREYAERMGYLVVGVYTDQVESGRTADRPQFQRMIADARKKERPFDMILVWKFSRFARNRQDAVVFKSMLKKHGVRVVSITEPSDDTPMGRMIEGVIESIDEFYSANLAQEVLRGMREAASRGFVVCSGTPYGYRRVKVLDGHKERPRLEPDPATGRVVQRAFKLVLEGSGLKEICATLNQEGIVGPRGKPWNRNTVHGLLTNEAYAGTLVWGRTSRASHAPKSVRVENAWEALVDKETFRRVQETMKERAPRKMNPRRVASSYLLSGLVKCATCGRLFTGQEAKSGRFAYYVCGTLLRRGRGTCDAPYLNARRLEELVIEKIKEKVLTEENLRELVRLVNEELDTATHEYGERLKVLEGELADVQRRLERLYDALETGKLHLDDLSPRIQELRQRQDQIIASRAELQELMSERRDEVRDVSGIVKYVEDMRMLLQESSLSEQKAFIRSFVKEIVVKGKEALLRYSLPLPPESLTGMSDPDDSGFPAGVLSSVRSGGPGRVRTSDPPVMSRLLCH